MNKLHILAIYTPEPTWDPLVELVRPLWQEYADRHGHRLVIQEAAPLYAEHYSFTKTRMVEAAVRIPKGGLFVIDLDMIPTNMTLPLQAPQRHGIVMGKDINGWNSGAYFIFKSQTSVRWLNTIVALRSVTSSEQHAMWLINEPFHVAEQQGLNSIPYEEYSYGLQEHHSQWQPGHFICHLPGRTNEDRIRLFTEKFIPQIVR